MTERPLHVLVAEALGWHAIRWQGGRGHIGLRPGADFSVYDKAHGIEPLSALSDVPRYDIDWSATGPLLERYRIGVEPEGPAMWYAEQWHAGPMEVYEDQVGPTPLVAVCNLILALHAAGKLPRPEAA